MIRKDTPCEVSFLIHLFLAWTVYEPAVVEVVPAVLVGRHPFLIEGSF